MQGIPASLPATRYRRLPPQVNRAHGHLTAPSHIVGLLERHLVSGTAAAGGVCQAGMPAYDSGGSQPDARCLAMTLLAGMLLNQDSDMPLVTPQWDIARLELRE